MKAAVYTEYGSPDVMKIKEVAKPVPTDNQVLVRVEATSVNRSDWEGLVGEPLYVRIGGLRKPRNQILGTDIAGRVEAVGQNVKKFKPGDEVFGDIMWDNGAGFAEYVCVGERHLALKPAGLTFEEAAAIPQAAVIALQGMRDHLQPGQKVLINGAGGGAGMYAIQFARMYGAAEITGVDNTEKLDFMRSMGADHVIDYTREDFTRNGKQYDLILDVIAQRSVFDYVRPLSPNGQYFAVGGYVSTFLPILFLGPVIKRFTGKKISILMVQPNLKDVLDIAELCEAGKIKTVIDKCFPLSETPEALGYLGEGHSRGKVVVKVGAN